MQDAIAGLEIGLMRLFEADLDEGAGHSGSSALIEMLARRAA